MSAMLSIRKFRMTDVYGINTLAQSSFWEWLQKALTESSSPQLPTPPNRHQIPIMSQIPLVRALE